jgi:23S rRNA (uracil1939-C5)-methyltransferase
VPDIEVDIDELSPAGDGVARADGRRVFVPFTIPGERVRVRIRPGARDDVSGTLLSVLRPSPHRIAPRCRHFGPDAEPGVGPCGGCSWQHIAYPEQLRLKTAIVERLVRATVRDAPAPLPMRAATPVDHPWGYRQKVHFVFGARGGDTRAEALAMGHYVRGSRRLIPVQECPVHDPRGNDLAFHLRDRYGRAKVTAADGRGPRVLSGVVIRAGHGTRELTATIIVTATTDKRLRTATRDVMKSEPDVAFHLNLHPEDDGFIFGQQTRRLSGPERMREEVRGTSFLISPTAFFQTNVAAAELLVDLVLAAVPASSRVLDLYAGAGLFAIPLALAGHTVTAVEENRAAVEDGIASARANRVDAGRCRFVARQSESAVGTAGPADVVVLDPPREGCAASVIDSVFGRLRPQTAVYVSCNPEALATDLRQITGRGYTVRSIQPIDMFPHTSHIEAVAVITR